MPMRFQRLAVRRAFLLVVAAAVLACVPCLAKTKPSSSQLPLGLPSVLTMRDGAPVKTATEWPARRAELERLFTEQMYGVAPPRPKSIRFVVVDDTIRGGGRDITADDWAQYLSFADMHFQDDGKDRR